MALQTERVALDHTTLMQIERVVETLDDRVRELTREIDGIDVEPEYTCDCSCNSEIEDLYSEIDGLTKRMEKLEALLTQQPG